MPRTLKLLLAAARPSGAQIIEGRQAVQHQMPRPFHQHHVFVRRRRIGIRAARLLHQKVRRLLRPRDEREEGEQQGCPKQ